MSKEEIIEGLKSLISDRESFITEDKKECEIFIKDKAILLAAIDYINNDYNEYKMYYESVYARFKHLIKSKFISKYDEYDLKKGNYKYDIEKVDKLIIGIKKELELSKKIVHVLVNELVEVVKEQAEDCKVDLKEYFKDTEDIAQRIIIWARKEGGVSDE